MRFCFRAAWIFVFIVALWKSLCFGSPLFLEKFTAPIEGFDVKTAFKEDTDFLTSKLYYGHEGLKFRYFRQYDNEDRVVAIILDNGSSEELQNLEGATDRWATMCTFDFQDPEAKVPLQISQTHLDCATGKETLLWRVNSALPKTLGSNKSLRKRPKKSSELQTTSQCTREQYFCLDPAEDHLAYILKTLLGNAVFQMSGYYVHPAASGIYGTGEIHDKVRITLINGILNFPDTHLENLEIFSTAHFGINIHYIFRPSEGWSHDVIGCIFSKLGIVSDQAKTLAKTWKDLIQEMGGPEGGGTIIHYAHSIGGTETHSAKNLMTPEEQKLIRIYTIGSPTLIQQGGFQSVVNYVSKRDGVSFIDIAGYIQGLLDPNSNVIYLDTYLGVPLIDHPLAVPAYRGIIEQLGREFIECYGNRGS
jgi:hypothetical protein